MVGEKRHCTAVAAQASPMEFLYMAEWIKYHMSVGFDDVYVYTADWALYGGLAGFPKMPDGTCSIDGHGVHIIPVKSRTGEYNVDVQARIYNDFIENKHGAYDALLCSDMDEFFVLNGFDSIDDYLDLHKDSHAIVLNWVLYGSSGKHYDGKDNSILKRFVNCGTKLNRFTKIMVNLEKCRNSNVFPKFGRSPHTIGFRPEDEGEARLVPSDGTDTPGVNKDVVGYRHPYLAHFYCKTLEEHYVRKLNYGIDFDKTSTLVKDFDEFDLNVLYRPLTMSWRDWPR